MLRPLDLVVLLKLVADKKPFSTYQALGEMLGMSSSVVYNSLQRAQTALLYDSNHRQPVLFHLQNFLLHGVPYVFYAEPGSQTRGVSTGLAAPSLRDKSHLVLEGTDLPVWPHATGTARGYALPPLHAAVPDAALRDPKLHELLALVDVLRDRRSRARERKAATDLLTEHLSCATPTPSAS